MCVQNSELDAIEARQKLLIENSVEIALLAFDKIKQATCMDRNMIIYDYIINWANEAEREYEDMWLTDKYISYDDFIKSFTMRKIDELLEKQN